MFTGIVEEVGEVRALDRSGDAVVLSVRAATVLDQLSLGDSVAVDGVCLTVTALDPEGFTVGLAPETLRRTAFSAVKPGERVNLERALRVDDRFGGHIVQGHVDGVARISGIEPDGDSVLMSFETTAALVPYIVEKGFVAIDGISLTVTGCEGNRFSVAIVAYTQHHVALVDKRADDFVNVEVDVIAKYVESILAHRLEGTRVEGTR